VDKEKALGQFRLRLNEAFLPYNKHGMDVEIPISKRIVEELALDLHTNLLINDSPDYMQIGRCLKEMLELDQEQYRQEGRMEAIKMMEAEIEVQPD
jgi:diphthamide biosynthesis methyltransferase